MISSGSSSVSSKSSESSVELAFSCSLKEDWFFWDVKFESEYKELISSSESSSSFSFSNKSLGESTDLSLSPLSEKFIGKIRIFFSL